LDLRIRKITPNCGHHHIIKVVCGYGKNPSGLIKNHREDIYRDLKAKKELDFAYIEKYGCFLIRVTEKKVMIAKAPTN
jgi:hypothetical protein